MKFLKFAKNLSSESIAEIKPAEDIPLETKAPETHEEVQPEVAKPAEDKPTERPAEEQTAENKPTEQPAEEKPIEVKPTEETPIQQPPAETTEKPVDQEPINESTSHSSHILSLLAVGEKNPKEEEKPESDEKTTTEGNLQSSPAPLKPELEETKSPVEIPKKESDDNTTSINKESKISTQPKEESGIIKGRKLDTATAQSDIDKEGKIGKSIFCF